MSQQQNITQDNFKVIIRIRPLNSKQQQQIQLYESVQLNKKSKPPLNNTNNNTNTPTNRQSTLSTPIKLPPSLYSFYTKFYSISSLSQILKVEQNIISVIDPEYKNTQKKLKPYKFSNIYNQKQTSQQIFNTEISQEIKTVFDGYNYTILAYGITGSGKTHTVFGGQSIAIDKDKKTQKGISQMALDYLIKKKKQIQSNINNVDIKLKFSFVQIYNQNLRDLLSGENNKMLNIIEDSKGNTVFNDAIQVEINEEEQITELINMGLTKRSLGATQANQYSSRSHAIIQVNVQIITQQSKINSKLFIIDLAGSQKIQTLNCSKKMQQGANINKSLLALGNCINILAQNTTTKKNQNNNNNNSTVHIPYRDSKLTRILKDSLGGNAKTLMISCVSSNPFTIEETITTLNYAQRAQGIKKQVKKNNISNNNNVNNNQSNNGGQNNNNDKICAICMKDIINNDKNLISKVFPSDILSIPQSLLTPSVNDQLFDSFFSQIYDDIIQNIKQKFAIQSIITQQKAKNHQIPSQIISLKQVNEDQKNQLKQTMLKLFKQKQIQSERKILEVYQYVKKINQNWEKVKKQLYNDKKKQILQINKFIDEDSYRITEGLWKNDDNNIRNTLVTQKQNKSSILSISRQKHHRSSQKLPFTSISNSSNSQLHNIYEQSHNIYSQSNKFNGQQSIKFLLQPSSKPNNLLHDTLNSRFSFATLLDSNIKNSYDNQNNQNNQNTKQNDDKRMMLLLTKRKKSRSKFEVVKVCNSGSKGEIKLNMSGEAVN